MKNDILRRPPTSRKLERMTAAILSVNPDRVAARVFWAAASPEPSSPPRAAGNARDTTPMPDRAATTWGGGYSDPGKSISTGSWQPASPQRSDGPSQKACSWA
jgi:hypothetical protein